MGSWEVLPVWKKIKYIQKIIMTFKCSVIEMEFNLTVMNCALWEQQ